MIRHTNKQTDKQRLIFCMHIYLQKKQVCVSNSINYGIKETIYVILSDLPCNDGMAMSDLHLKTQSYQKCVRYRCFHDSKNVKF